MMQTLQLVHVNYPSINSWVLRLAEIIRNSPKPVQDRLVVWWRDSYENVLALASKLEMLRVVTSRLETGLERIAQEMADRQDDTLACLDEGSAFHVRGDDLIWETLTDLEGFFFEARSVYELLGKLLTGCFVQVIQRSIRESDIVDALRELGTETRWIEVLRTHRILFFHNTAPYLSAQVVSRSPLRLDWIVMKKNFSTPEKEEDYLSLSEFWQIYNGLARALQDIEYWIENELEKIDPDSWRNRLDRITRA